MWIWAIRWAAGWWHNSSWNGNTRTTRGTKTRNKRGAHISLRNWYVMWFHINREGRAENWKYSVNSDPILEPQNRRKTTTTVHLVNVSLWCYPNRMMEVNVNVCLMVSAVSAVCLFTVTGNKDALIYKAFEFIIGRMFFSQTEDEGFERRGGQSRTSRVQRWKSRLQYWSWTLRYKVRNYFCCKPSWRGF